MNVRKTKSKVGKTMEGFIWETAEELDLKLAQRVRNIRKRRSISQEKLASMSGARRICSAIGGIPPAVKRHGFYSALTIAA